MATSRISKDRKWFNDNLASLLTEHRGKWAVVFECSLVGTFDSMDEAYNTGVSTTGSEKILVVRITDKEEPFNPSVNLMLGFLNG